MATIKEFKLIQHRPFNYMDYMDEVDKQSETTRRQLEDNSKTKIETSQRHLEDKLKTSRRQKTHIRDISETISETPLKTSQRHLEDISETNTLSINSVGGSLKIIVLYFFDLCRKLGNRKISNIPIDKIVSDCNINILTVKKSIQRLEQKGLIIRRDFKRGRSGWSTYEIHTNLWQELTISETSQRQLRDNSESKIETISETISPYSNNNITTTTKNEHPVNNLPEEWRNINYEPLKHIGFSETHLLQLFTKNLNIPPVIQQSINHFAFGLEHVDKTKSYKDPIVVFMGVLRQGQSWAEANYQSAADKALKRVLELQKQEDEKRNIMHKELFHIKYRQWFNKISDIELKLLLPNCDFSLGKYTNQIEIQSESIFRQTKWLEILSEIEGKTKN